MCFHSTIRIASCTLFIFASTAVQSLAQERIQRPPKPGNVPDVPTQSIPIETPLAIPLVTPPAPNVPGAVITNVELPAPELPPGLGLPEGLATKPEILFATLGFGPPHCFVLTPITCFDAGYKCYSLGMYQDALAFVNHGLKLSNHARLYLLKAVCEMHLGHCQDAGEAILRYRVASLLPAETFGLGPARERINDPMRVRLEYLLMATR